MNVVEKIGLAYIVTSSSQIKVGSPLEDYVFFTIGVILFFIGGLRMKK